MEQRANPIDRDEIRARIGSVQLTTRQQGAVDLLKEKAFSLMMNLVAHTEPSREQSEALTCFEDAVMWATKAIARRPWLPPEEQPEPEAATEPKD